MGHFFRFKHLRLQIDDFRDLKMQKMTTFLIEEKFTVKFKIDLKLKSCNFKFWFVRFPKRENA